MPVIQKRSRTSIVRGLVAVIATIAVTGSLAWGGVPLRVTVDGVDGAVRDNVLGFLGIEQNREQEGLSDAQVTLLHRRAPDEIRKALQPFGFYRATIEANLERDPDGGWLASYRIEPGLPILVGTVDVELRGEAVDDPAFARLLDGLPLHEGVPLLHADYDRARGALQRLATERGYLDAQFTRRELRIDLETYVAEARITLDSGRRYRFGAIRFDQDVLDEELLRRYVPFNEGEPFHAAKLLRLQTVLTGSNFFAEVRVVPRIEAPVDGAVPIDIVLAPRPAQRYTLSGGYGTDTGLRGRISWEWRPANRSGHALTTGVELAQQRKAGVIRYTVPMWDPRHEQLDFTGSLTEEDSTSSFSRVTQFGAALQLGKRRLKHIWSLDYKNEESETGGEFQKADMVIPGVNATYTRADDKLRVTRGYRIDAGVHGGSELLGSDISFGQMNLLGKYIISPWQDTRLIARFELGTTWTDDFDSLPVSERFYAGGDESIRGYEWRSLGPVNEAGEVIGGPHIAVGSFEVEHYVGTNWGLALFVDAGNAFDDTLDDVFVGAGIGLRWRTPIGAIRIDVAQAIDYDDNAWRLHLQLGPEL